MNKVIVIFLIMFSLLPISALNGEDLFFTYIGVSAGGGFDYIELNDWFKDEAKRDTKNISGSYLCGGIILNIYVKNLAGEFTLQYINNVNNEIPVNHMMYNAAGKYLFTLTKSFFLTAGIGMYLESPPSNRDYNGGGGGSALCGIVFSPGRDWKLIFDAIGRYGYFGIGEKSTRYSYGAKIGVLYKIGRI